MNSSTIRSAITSTLSLGNDSTIRRSLCCSVNPGWFVRFLFVSFLEDVFCVRAIAKILSRRCVPGGVELLDRRSNGVPHSIKFLSCAVLPMSDGKLNPDLPDELPDHLPGRVCGFRAEALHP